MTLIGSIKAFKENLGFGLVELKKREKFFDTRIGS